MAAQAAKFGWLGRLEGAPNVPAAQTFKGMGVPMADNAQVVRFISSQHGKPEVEDNETFYRYFFLIGCGLVTFLFLVAAAISLWAGRGEEKALGGAIAR